MGHGMRNVMICRKNSFIEEIANTLLGKCLT
jgi:hypothetical protein